MSNVWTSFKEWARWSKNPNQELNKSGYSLVSCGELNADTLQLWLGLPEEVKNDPALAPFRQHYEKEHGASDSKKKNAGTKKRLPSVNSAPHLNQSLKLADEVEFSEGPKTTRDIADVPETEAIDDTQCNNTKKDKLSKAKYYTKMTILLACWVFFTAIFLMYNEKHDIVRISSVSPGELKNYTIQYSEGSLAVLVRLSGPFLSENEQIKLNSSQYNQTHKMEVWLERWALNNSESNVNMSEVIEQSKRWSILLMDNLDFNEGEDRTSTLKLEPSTEGDVNHNFTYTLRIRTTSTQATPFTISYTVSPLDATTGVAYACVLLCGLYILIIFEVINRTMAAITLSTMSLAALALTGERPTLPEVISWLDEETLLLLFSMMLLVAIMAETGIFDFLAVFTFEVTKGKLWPLIYLLCAITAILSTFLDNVTTVLLMSPVTIRLCEVMELDPVPILMFMAIYSNVGGTATPVGDPPNVIVVSNKAVMESGITFTNFTAHMGLGILLICIQTSLQIKYIYRDANKLRLTVPRDIQDLTRQITIWRRAADSLPHLSRDVHVVRERLERKITKLKAQLDTMVKKSSKRACPKETFQSTLIELKEKYKIRDKALLIKGSLAIMFVVVVFFLHSIPELNRVSLGWTALLGAILLLTLADREDLEPILHRVEWSTLLFFAALFVLMEALSKLGLIAYIGDMMEQLILRVDESARLAVALMLIIWVSGTISAFVDNIPLTTMMVRVVVAIGSNPNLNLPMPPLIWALLFGACLGGNGTLIGASANVVCAGVAEQHGYQFTFTRFFKVGFPVMIGHLVVASAYLLICHCVFSWH